MCADGLHTVATLRCDDELTSSSLSLSLPSVAAPLDAFCTCSTLRFNEDSFRELSIPFDLVDTTPTQRLSFFSYLYRNSLTQRLICHYVLLSDKITCAVGFVT